MFLRMTCPMRTLAHFEKSGAVEHDAAADKGTRRICLKYQTTDHKPPNVAKEEIAFTIAI